MKAIIMAGGEGTRLRPLTCDTPKPMMRLMNRPIIEYALELLAIHGIPEAAVTLGYLPERIRDHLDDEACSVKLKYYTERRPLGTAGGVKQARDFLSETFCVLSGDGVTDCDLTAALENHRQSGAPATMVLKHVPDPTPYGLVITAPDGRITRFMEKPGWGEVISDTVNTGIYILEPSVLDMIPDGEYDFGSQLFPVLAEKGLLNGYIADGYWCDVGDISAYLQMCRDALDGRIALPSLHMPESRITICDGTDIHPSARIESPCFIGPGVHIARGAHIGAYTILDSGVRISENASTKRCVIWPDTHLGAGAQVRGSVLSRSVQLADCARTYENCAIGAGAVIGTDSEIAPGVSIWPGKHVGEAVLTGTNIVWGGGEPACFHDGILPAPTPAEALKAALAFAAALQPTEILIGRAHSANAEAMWHSCTSGLMAQGIQVTSIGPCTLPRLRHSMELMQAECGIMVTSTSLILLDSSGAQLSRAHRRSICAYMTRQDYPRVFTADARPVIYTGSSDRPYIAMLASAFCADQVLASPAAVYSEDPVVLDIAERAFSRAGLTARFEWEDELMELFPGETGIWLSPDGVSARFSHSGGMLTDPQTELLTFWTAIERGEKQLIVREHATQAISEIADRNGVQLSRISGDRAAYEQALSSRRTQFLLNTDGIYLALSVMSALTENALTLSGWLSTMPKVHRAEKHIHIDDSLRGSVLRRFSEQHTARAHSKKQQTAYAWISPSEDRPECTVYAESRDMEAARELCDFYISELQKTIESSPKA